MPWNKSDNPFEPPKPQQPKKVSHPPTGVTVRCHSPSCLKANKNRSVNIRVEADDNGVKHKHCRDCQWQWEVRVAPSGGVKVWQSDQNGANRREIPREVFYQK
jgi:hypothetical protein